MNSTAFVEDGRGRRIDTIAQSAPPVPMLALVALADPHEGEWPLREYRVLALVTCVRHARRPEDADDGDAVTLDQVVTTGMGTYLLSDLLDRPGAAGLVVEEAAYRADPQPFHADLRAEALDRAREEGLDIDYVEAADNLTPTIFPH